MPDSTPHSAPFQGREPTNADLARMISSVSTEQGKQSDRMTKIENALLGTIEPPRQGLMDQVRDMRKKMGSLTKLGWAAMSGAAVALATMGVKKITGGGD